MSPLKLSYRYGASIEDATEKLRYDVFTFRIVPHFLSLALSSKPSRSLSLAEVMNNVKNN